MRTRWFAILVVGLLVQACSNGTSGGSPGTGGSVTSTGGSKAQGGVLSSGGASASTGGSSAVGGTAAGGSTTGSGGAGGVASGGSSAGGATSTGGANATGGGSAVAGGAGGKLGAGGQAGSTSQGGTAGNPGSGGATSTGGTSTISCPNTVATPGNTTHTIQVGGRSRTYVLHIPSGYTGKTAAPLLVDFHPHGSTGPSWQTGSPYPAVVDRDGVVSAYPSAVGDWNVGPCCSDGVDDVEFAKALVTEVKGIVCVDVKRIYAAGFSMGGGMTNYVACRAADVFAAFAPAAFDLLQENVGECKPGRPITVAAYRGTADPLVPYAGGLSNLVRPITFLGAVNTMKKWAELSTCAGSAADLGNGCQGYASSQCQGGVEVILCTKQGGGHDAADPTLIWPVLKRHTLP